MRKVILAVAAALVTALFPGCGNDGKTGGTPSAASDSTPLPGPVEVVTRSGVEMVALPGGSFVMGSDQGAADERPAHRVTVSAFLIDRFEVTHEMYAKAQLPDPSHWKDNPRSPVEKVRWRDAKQYCNERSLLEGLKPCYDEKTPDWNCDPSATGYRLPTEAEWEFASRAGTDGPHEFGGADRLRQYAWMRETSGEKTHVVGQKKPNRWGIFDLAGNVSEWCEDVYASGYGSAAAVTDPQGPPSPGGDVRRVIRGGSWRSSADECRVSARQGERTGDSDACFSTDYCGFRCVRRATPAEIAALKAPAK
jgi:formylglycine-generating enzyme